MRNLFFLFAATMRRSSQNHKKVRYVLEAGIKKTERKSAHKYEDRSIFFLFKKSGLVYNNMD